MKVVTSKISKDVTFKLDDKQIAEKARSAANLVKDIAKAELEREEMNNVFKARIKDAEARRDSLLEQIDKGEYTETVQCKMAKDFKNREIRFYYEGKVIERRPMTDQEAQMEMKLKTKVSKRQKLENTQTPEPDADVQSVIKEETNRRTKLSAVDGATA